MKRVVLNILLILGCTTMAVAQFPANIGKIPAGKTITICYEVRVDDDTPINTTEICEQGSITYEDPNNPMGTLNMMTDDPDSGSPADPTCTQVLICNISDIQRGNATCEPGNTTYSQDIIVTYEGGGGNLLIDANGMMFSFGQTVSPQTVTLAGLPIDGNPVTVSAEFEGVTGCEKTEVDLYVAPTPLTVNAGVDKNICQGNNVNLTATPTGGTGPFQYAWMPGGGTMQMINVSPATTTDYTVTVTDNNGCMASDVVKVFVENIPVMPRAISGPASICPTFNNLQYSIPPIPNATSYQWSFSNSSATISGSGTQVSISFDGSFTGGTLSVKATNGCGTSAKRQLAIVLANGDFCEFATCLSEAEALIIDNSFINALDVFQNYNRIESDGMINAPRNVTFKAGNEILLKAPFEVKLGAVFIAEIEACLQSISKD